MNGTRISPGMLHALTVQAGGVDHSVIEGVRRLSSLFTVARPELGHDYLADAALRRAYLLYFLPVNLAKVTSVLAEIPALPQRPLRVLDVGAGPGTGALAVLDYLMMTGGLTPGTEIIAVDRSREALRDAEALWTAASGTTQPGCAPRLQVCTLNLERPSHHPPWHRKTFDLILVSNVLNELFREARNALARRVKLIEQLLASLASDGTLILIEPALRQTTRALHEVRDRLVIEEKATIYSPCLHEQPCPALLKPDDWCHEERPWSLPPIVAEIDRHVGFIKDALKFSYVVLRTDGRTIVNRAPTIHRVVSEKLIMKGEQRVWLCNETGRQLVGRLDKDRSVDNADFDSWDRGAIVRIDEIERRGAVGRIRGSATAGVIRLANYSKASKGDFSENGC